MSVKSKPTQFLLTTVLTIGLLLSLPGFTGQAKSAASSDQVAKSRATLDDLRATLWAYCPIWEQYLGLIDQYFEGIDGFLHVRGILFIQIPSIQYLRQ